MISRPNLIVAVAALALIGIVFLVPDGDEETGPGATTTTVPPQQHPADPTAATPAPVEYALVVGVGDFAEWDLAANEYGAAQAGVHVQVVGFDTEREVLALLEEEDPAADVIEVGFRPELLSGRLADRFQALDPALIPSLDLVYPELRLPGDFGVATGVAGLFGLVYDADQVAGPPESWEDLFSVDGQVFIPAPVSPYAVLLVLELGQGDVETGVLRYLELVRTGAVLVTSTTDVVEAVGAGVGMGAWTSSGAWLASQPVPAIGFAAPVDGAPILPTFSGVLARAEQARTGMKWLEERLSLDIQQQMARRAAFSEGGLPAQLAVGPAIPGVPLPSGFEDAPVLEREEKAEAVDWARFVEVEAQVREAIGGGGG